MSWLMEVALNNVGMAAALALVAACAGRCLRRPALTHALWLLVFIKLITPPLFPLPVGWLIPEARQEDAVDSAHAPSKTPGGKAESPSPERDLVSAPVTPAKSVGNSESDAYTPDAVEPASVATPGVEPAPRPALTQETPPADVEARDAASISIPWLGIAGGLWLGGSLAWFGLVAVRLRRFQRLLRQERPAGSALQAEAAALAERLGIPCPRVWVVPGRVSPMLWVLSGEARLVLPDGLLERLSAQQRQALLVHELAHWRRCDHWVRRLELVVLGLYWWCPLVWWARAELEQAEEECCDAWVVWALPAAARDYALALVETVDFMSGAPAGMPPVASGIGQVHHLRRRLTMILNGKTPRALTLGGGFVVLGLGAMLLPWMPTWAQAPPAHERLAQEQHTPLAQAAPDPLDARYDLQKRQAELERARADFEKMQADLARVKNELDRRSAELQETMKRFADQEKKAAWVTKNPDPTTKETTLWPQPVQGGKPGSDVNRRLEILEKKIDELIKEVRGLRGGTGSNHYQKPAPGQGPGGGFSKPAPAQGGANTPPPAFVPQPSVTTAPPGAPGNAPGFFPPGDPLKK